MTKRFLDEAQEELKKKCRGLSKPAVGSLFSYEWPGNVRELRNVIRQAVLLCEENAYIKPGQLMLSGHLTRAGSQTETSTQQKIYDRKKSLKDLVRPFTNDLEKKIISEAIAVANGNKSEAARRLKIDYKTLLRKMKD